MKNKFNIKEKSILFLGIIFIGYFAWALFNGIGSICNKNSMIPIVVAIGIIAIIIGLLNWKKFKRIICKILTVIEKNIVLSIVIISILAILLRFIPIFLLQPEPVRDFQRYHECATIIADGSDWLAKNDKVEFYRNYMSIFPNVYGYCWMLGGIYKIFGNNLLVGQAVNIVAQLISSLLVYYIVKMISQDKKKAFLAFLIMSMFPSKIIFSAIVSSEAVYEMLMLLSVALYLYLYYKFDQINIYRKIIGFALIGIIIALGMIVRGSTVIVPLAMGIHFILYKTNNKFKEFLKKLAIIMTMCISIILVNNAFSFYISKTIGKEVAKSTNGYFLYVGSNMEHNGTWNQKDSNRYGTELLKEQNKSLKEANSILLNDAIKRYTKDFTDTLELLLKKATIFASTDEYGGGYIVSALSLKNNYTTQNKNIINNMILISNIYYFIIVIYSIYEVYLIIKNKNVNDDISIFILIILGLAGMHLLTEVHNRYHYGILSMLSIIAAIGIYNNLKKNGDEESA